MLGPDDDQAAQAAAAPGAASSAAQNATEGASRHAQVVTENGAAGARRPGPVTLAAAMTTDVVNALLDLSSVKGVRFNISRDFWVGFPFHGELEPRVSGKILQWLNKGELRVRVEWDNEDEVEPLQLTDMLPCDMQLEAYDKNRAAPHPKRRRNADGTIGGGSSSATAASGPPLPLVVPANGEPVVMCKYKMGGREFHIGWTKVSPEGIAEDARTEQRWRPQIKKDKSEYKSAYLMWVNVALPWNFVKKMFDNDGFLNQRLSDKDNSAYHRKTTVGEGIAFLGYMLAIANNPGVPVRDMWQEAPRCGEKAIMPPPGIGRFGISRDRFDRLVHLMASLHSVGESELDESDPWRYCNLPIDSHNEHWKMTYNASWLLAPDESMCPYVPSMEGDGAGDLPFMSNVPRKPKPLGAEIKTVADGESGAIMFMELALKYKRKRGDPQVVPPFAEQPGKDTMEAQCLRLTEPWHSTGRAVGADAHFMSVASCEAMREKGLYPFGDLKTATTGFPKAELEAWVGNESGDWAVMKSSLPNADNSLVFGVAHRRGEAVHTYISTHGLTKRGKDQRHNDDYGDDGSLGPRRKCPRILNDWTQAQPHIDKNNRWRQYELAIEERFRTRSFPFRLFTTVIVGMSIANAWALYQYHMNASQFDSFREFVSEVAYDAMTNTHDKDHPPFNLMNAFSFPPASSAGTSACLMPSSASQENHQAIPIRTLPGWKGKHQQRCSECCDYTTFCCGTCSTSNALVAIHPASSTYNGITKRQYGCMGRHKRHPDLSRRSTFSISRSVAAKRRNHS